MTREQVWPLPRPSEEQSVPLSILDNTVVRYAPTGAIFFYECLPDNASTPSELSEYLKCTLSSSLQSFPHFAGQLHWSLGRQNGLHTERRNRLWVTWGKESDPGIEWNVVHHASDMSNIVPSTQERMTGNAVWLGDSFSQNEYVSPTKLPMNNMSDYMGLSAVLIQLNFFADGGYAVGIKIAHPLADAHSLMLFMRHWAATSQLQCGNVDPSPRIEPLFDPSMLDAAASGDIDATEQNEDLVTMARALPRRRFDWWDTDAPDFPVAMKPSNDAWKPSDARLLFEAIKSPTEPAPWGTWNLTSPVSFALIHFSNEELSHLRDVLRKSQSSGGDEPSLPISRLDAVLAHIWSIVNHIRFADDDVSQSDDIAQPHLHLTLGARSRTSPPLRETFLGSPLFQGFVKEEKASFRNLSPEFVGAVACQIRQTTAHTFSPAAVGAMLHEMAFEVAPQRIWNVFLGSYHTIATSWLRLGLYDISFGSSSAQPVYVHAIMPRVNGCVQIMDAAGRGGTSEGIDVALTIETSVAEGILRKELLRPWSFDGAYCKKM